MSAPAHASFNSSRWVKAERTCGSPVTPHLRRKGEFDATALFCITRSAITGTTAEISRTRNDFPPKFSNFWTKRSVERLLSVRGMRNAGAGSPSSEERGAASNRGGCPRPSPKLFEHHQGFVRAPSSVGPPLMKTLLGRLGHAALAGPFLQRTNARHE